MKKFLRVIVGLLFSVGAAGQDTTQVPQWLLDNQALIDSYYVKNDRNFIDLTWKTRDLLIQRNVHNIGRGMFLNNYIGYYYQYENPNIDSALWYYKTGAELIKTGGGEQTVLYANALSNIGNLIMDLGFYNEAESYITRARDLRVILKDTVGIDYYGILNNLGICYLQTSRFSAAESYFTRVLPVAELPGTEVKKTLFFYNNLASLYKKMASYEKADFYYQKSYALAIKTKDAGAPQIANNLAFNYFLAGKQQKAKEMFANIYRAAAFNNASAKTVTTLAIYNNYSNVLLRDRLYQEGLKILKHAEDTAAKFHLTKSAAFAAILANRGHFLSALNRTAEAADYYYRALELEATLNQFADAGTRIDIYSLLARLYIQAGDYRKAIPVTDTLAAATKDFIKKTYVWMSEHEKLAFVNSLQAIAGVYPALLAGMKTPPPELVRKAFDYLQFYNGLVTSNQAVLLKKMYAAALPAIREQYERLKEYKLYLLRQYQSGFMQEQQLTDSIELQTDRLERQLFNQDFFNAVNMQDEMRGSILADALPPSSAIVQFVRFEQPAPGGEQRPGFWYGAFVIQPGSAPRFMPLCSEEAIAALLKIRPGKALSDSVFNSVYPDMSGKDAALRVKASAGMKLYALTWKQLEPLITDAKTVYCITDGLLHQVAHHALPISSSERLADRFTVQYLFNCRTFLEDPARASAFSSASLWGGINYGAPVIRPKRRVQIKAAKYWLPIPESMKEISNIGLLLKKRGMQSVIITSGNKASEPALASLNGHAPEILHLSTHGYFTGNLAGSTASIYDRAQNPLINCGLVMAGRNNKQYQRGMTAGEDGLLTGYEISLMDLSNLKLVVLSACETGLGAMINNEGVFGLQRAFKLAGAGQMVVSLWSVPDAQTAELMRAFYQHLMQGVSVPEALRVAQQEMSAKYPPYFWAAFKALR